MKQIIHNQYCLQEKPWLAVRAEIFNSLDGKQKLLFENGSGRRTIVDLPKGEWEISFLASEATEEQAKGIVSRTELVGTSLVFYENYETGIVDLSTDIESLFSLIRSHGMKVSECLIFKNLNHE